MFILGFICGAVTMTVVTVILFLRECGKSENRMKNFFKVLEELEKEEE